MLKRILLDLLFIGLYYTIYKFGGFELAVIIAIGQIMSSIVQKNSPKKIKSNLPTYKQVYVQPTTKMKF